MRKSNLRQIAVYTGVWLLIAVLFSALLNFSNSQTASNRAFSWISIFLWQAIIYSWALLFPAINRFVARFRFERSNWWRVLPLHLVSALFFTFAHALIYIFFFHLFTGFTTIADNRFFETAASNYFRNWTLDFSMYFLISSIVTARDYYRRFQAEQLKSSELKAALSSSELQALKMQLHPHFLFNTLNSISTLMHEDLQAADRMVARLGDFLRMTLANSGEQFISLAQEMEFVNCYLEIESVRFGERLSLEEKIEPETLVARVPNLILQPLIENAIKHGISRQIRPGKISIRARRVDEFLRLEVEDNGPGLQKNEPGAGVGIGLANTRARLAHLYDGRHRVEFTPRAPQGLIVTLELPFETKREITDDEGRSD